MKELRLVIIFLLSIFTFQSNAQLKAPGVKWDDSYSFDQYNSFQIEFYAKNNELMRTQEIKTYFQANGENFAVQYISEIKGNGMKTILDKSHQVAIQIMGEGGGAKPFYNVGGFKYPEVTELKKLELVATNETKEILGIPCKKYTYTYKKIFGEVWITDQVKMPNDLGVFRAAKMAALHNTLSADGFVMEMTTEDSKGGKTLMKTISLKNQESNTFDLKGVEMNTANNKVNSFTF